MATGQVRGDRASVQLRATVKDLIEFLRARLNEDERIARAADDDGMSGVPGEHIVRWDPARVPAEVEAKRRIIDLCEEWIEIGEIPPNATWSDEAAGGVVARDVLSLLALPYADHADYDLAWAPSRVTDE